jgi:hypothetical protein
MAGRATMTRMAARLTTLPVILLACVPGARAGAEQERVDGMGRTQGWVVATEDGELDFVDCRGRRSALGSARIEPSTKRCPAAPTPLEMTGVIQGVDPVRRVVHAQDDTGSLRTFYITDDVSRLEQFKPGDRIRVTGPIDGQATRITRP